MRRSQILVARRGALIGVGLALAVTILAVASISSWRRPAAGLSPEALQQIDARNRNAAALSAAKFKAEAAAATRAADHAAATHDQMREANQAASR